MRKFSSRLATAALAAAMVVTTATPAMAAITIDQPSTTKNVATADKEGVEEGSIAAVDIKKDNGSGAEKHKYSVITYNTFDDGFKLNLDTLTDKASSTAAEKHTEGTAIGDSDEKDGDVRDYDIVPTSKASYTTTDNGPATIKYSVQTLGNTKHASVTLNSADAQVAVVPQTYGVTYFKITEDLTFWADTDNTESAEAKALKGDDITVNSNGTISMQAGSFDKLVATIKDGAQYNAGFWNYAKGKKSYTATIVYYVGVKTAVTKENIQDVVASATPAAAADKTTAAKNVQKAVKAAIAAKAPVYIDDENLAESDMNLEVVVPSIISLSDSSIEAAVSVNDASARTSYLLNANFKYTTVSPYTDVALDAYYYNNVLDAVADGAFPADSETVWGADDEVSRIDFVYAMWKKAGAPQVSTETNFTDLTGLTDDQVTAVNWAVSKHLTYGIGGTEFDPQGKLTRAQVVQFIWYLAGQPNNTKASTFNDVADTAWYATSAAWGEENGIVAGYADGSYGANSLVVKKEAVAFLYRS